VPEPTLPRAPFPRIPGSAQVVLAELVSSAEPLAVLTSDARRRWQKLGGQSGIGRFRATRQGGAIAVSGRWSGSPDTAEPPFAGGSDATVLLTDYATLGRLPAILDGATNVYLLDPPASTEEEAAAGGCGAGVYTVTDPASLSFALAASADRHALTPALRVLYRDLREAGSPECGGQAAEEPLRAALSGSGEVARSPERAALLLRVLEEAGLAHTAGSGHARTAGVVSSDSADLSRSPLFSEHERIHQEQVRFLKASNN
jgi:hypothetical protein